MQPFGRLFLLLAGCAFGAAHAAVEDGAGVVERMHAKYRDAWFTTAQFAQKTTHYDADGKADVAMWYERMRLPGKLRIDIGPAKDGNAMILADGRMHTFRQGSVVDSRPLVSVAMLLGFDVYRQPADVTLAQLKHEGIDTAKLHEERWQGRPAWVVGAARGDLESSQVWIDKERLLLVRIIQPARDKPGPGADIRFSDFRTQKRGVIAARIDVHQNGRMVMSEEYSGIETDMPLDPAWFVTSRLSTPASGN